MAYDDETLAYIFNKSAGRCRYCTKQLSWSNYGKLFGRGAWEVDHSVPRSRGGTDYLRNLFAACIECNRNKSARTGQTFRRVVQPVSTRSASGGLGDVIAALVGLGLLIWFLRSLGDAQHERRTQW